MNSGGSSLSSEILERGGSLCPLFDLCLQMTWQEIKDETRSDYCRINTETECPHLLPHIRPKYVRSVGDLLSPF